MASSAVSKFKQFFALDGTMPADDSYMAEDNAYEERSSYGYQPTHAAHSDYTPARRSPQPSVVPVDVRGFSTVRHIGEAFRDGNIVVFTLSELPRDEARRVVDYAAGLCHGLRGRMQKLPRTSFGLIPEGVEIETYELEDALEF
ncbi:cell division protein SepF [Corynebacterium mendelii]|uniref:Cell division protein SepF n=1 Tax=Corynebacterium mendelii TaxID=2765362 RepID=A0A939DY46_9CORY|nr:cell division protein SepF [Corynebacterium mendelii]MBN9643108.1 cell division protein SepF [Corynebacterium mendelii]